MRHAAYHGTVQFHILSLQYTPSVMNTRTLLIFDLNGALFAVDAALVRETVWLPELTPVEEAPPYIAGIFSLRGQIVPVTDLHLRFGHLARDCKLSDQIVVLQLGQQTMGLIVSEVVDVLEVRPEDIQPPPDFDETPRHLLVAGEVRVGDDLVTLLDTSQLFRPEFDLAAPERAEGGPQAIPEHHAVLRARAIALMEVLNEADSSPLALAVVELGGEHFGIALDAVQEFCDLTRIAPVPCCPSHILGAISLRGDLFTLLDIGSALNLAPATAKHALITRSLNWPGSDEQAVGVALDAVHEVVYLSREALQPAPEALREQYGAEIVGAAHYEGRMMAVLDLTALLARSAWIVSETA